MVRVVFNALIDVVVGLLIAGVVATATVGIRRSAPLDSPAWLWGLAGGCVVLVAVVHHWVSGRRPARH